MLIPRHPAKKRNIPLCKGALKSKNLPFLYRIKGYLQLLLELRGCFGHLQDLLVSVLPMKFVSFVSLVSVVSVRELVLNKWRILPWATGSILFDTLSLFPNTHKID